MSMKLFNHIAEMDTPTLSSVDRNFLLVLSVKCDDEGRLLCTSKAAAFIMRMDRGHFSRKLKELVEKGILVRTGLGVAISEAIVQAATKLPATQPVLPAGQQGGVAGLATAVAAEALPFPPHPLTPNKNINHEYSIDPPIIPPSQTNGTITCMGQNPNVTVVKAEPTYWEKRAARKPWREYIEEQRQAYLASKPQYTKEQEAFLEVYPKAPGDPAAFVLAWEQSIAQDVLPRELIDAARIASNSPAFKEKEGQFIPKPERWLGAKNWGPIVEPWRAERKRKAMQEDANQPPPDVDFDPFGKDLQDANVTSDIVVPFEIRDTSYWEPNEAEITRFRAVSSITAWINARNNKRALTKQPLRDAAREVLNFFLIQDMQSDKPYIPSNRIAWLNTNIVRVSPEETLTPEQAICLARQDLNR